jgi:hypothetical protein
MPFPFAFAWLNAFQAVRHSHNPQIPTSAPHTCQSVHMKNGTPQNNLQVLRSHRPIARVY